MNVPLPISPEELKLISEAKELADLRRLPVFNRLMLVVQQAVDAARDDLLYNVDPRMKDRLVAEYCARNRMKDFINHYIDAVASNRRETVKELFRAIGISEDLIEHNLDASLDFLMPQTEAQNGRK